MNLLPKSTINFAQRDYWNDFFTSRNNKEFEWYGEYPELCSHLHKYIKPKDNILVVGCGNSQLSSNLYDVGCRNIFNIDVSTVVVKQMKQLHKDRTDMKYEVMDALKMDFPNDSYSVVLDKGTLDALMPQDVEEDCLRGHKLLEEVCRVLKLGGRYLVISLLQPHILRTLVDFSVEQGWMLRVCRCHEVEEKTLQEFGQLRMPVFMVICTKFKKIANVQTILELNIGGSDKQTRVNSADEVLKAVKEVQEATAMCSAIQKQSLKEEVELEFRQDGDTTARYTIRVVDKRSHSIKSYAALIVPHGRETEWMFGTPTGREILRKSSGFDRLAVVNLHRDHSYPSLEAIQHELGGTVVQLAPSGASSPIPYVTVGDGIGSRTSVYTGSSHFSGKFIVEDVLVDQDRFRRLVFLDNQSVIQSEAKLKQVQGKKGSKRWVVDTTHVACSHHCYMAIAVNAFGTTKCSVLVLGLGGGGLCTLLHRVFPATKTTAVDIDPAIVDVAKQFFSVIPDDRLDLKVAEGVQFIKDSHETSIKYDVILVDVDSKTKTSSMSCPPPQFVSEETLDLINSILTENGILVVNVVCRIEEEKVSVVNRLKTKFRLVTRYNLEEDVNEIIFASNRSDLSTEEWISILEKSANDLNGIASKKLGRKENFVDVNHFYKALTIS